jgi:hypothetical protein
MKRALKGQLVFEFVIATLFFLAITMHTLNLLSYSVGSYSSDYRTNSMESRAWQVSEILVRKPGSWSGGDPNMVPSSMGLASQWPELSMGKIRSLDNYCGNPSNWNRAMRLLNVGLPYEGISISIDEVVGGVDVNRLDCGTTQSASAIITRYGISDESGGILKVSVTYW